MPKIPLPERKKYKRNKESRKRDNLNHKAVYNSKRWRTMRIEKLKRDTLCEICLKAGKLSSGVEVHHITPISTGKTIKEKQRLGFDPLNLMTLCQQCHKDQHNDNFREKDLFNPQSEHRSNGFSFI